jgi:MOSC domain-containing protein YiiM
MMDGMHVETINIGTSDALGPVGSVRAIAGHGLEGDRYFFADGAGSGEALTLIEAEALEDVGLTGTQSRRQVVVRGVRVNDLVGKRFRVGDVECLGVELCEPCLHLQKLTRPGIIKDLIHRGGLRADIVSGGTISIGDRVRQLSDPEGSSLRVTDAPLRSDSSRAAWTDR